MTNTAKQTYRDALIAEGVFDRKSGWSYIGGGHFIREVTSADNGLTLGFESIHEDCKKPGMVCKGYTAVSRSTKSTSWLLLSKPGEPVTLSPSIHCGCGDHGFVREGRWVVAGTPVIGLRQKVKHKENIRRWFFQGLNGGYKWMIIKEDKDTKELYPVFVVSATDFYDRYYRGVDRVVESYNLEPDDMWLQLEVDKSFSRPEVPQGYTQSSREYNAEKFLAYLERKEHDTLD